MPNLLYDLSIAPMLRALRNLDAIVGKAEAYAAADEGIDPNTLIQARLHPNMRPLRLPDPNRHRHGEGRRSAADRTRDSLLGR